MMMMKESAISYSHASADFALVLVLLVPLPVVRDHELWSVEKIVYEVVSDLSPVLLLLLWHLVLHRSMSGLCSSAALIVIDCDLWE